MSCSVSIDRMDFKANREMKTARDKSKADRTASKKKRKLETAKPHNDKETPK